MNRVNPFPPPTASTPLVAITPCPLIFLSNLSIEEKAALIANLGKTSLANEEARSISAFFPQVTITLSYVLRINPPDSIILGNSALLSFITVHILLAKAFLILFFCFVVKNNS